MGILRKFLREKLYIGRCDGHAVFNSYGEDCILRVGHKGNHQTSGERRSGMWYEWTNFNKETKLAQVELALDGKDYLCYRQWVCHHDYRYSYQHPRGL